MRFFVVFISFTLLAISGIAQTLKKYPIAKSGCSAHFFCNPGNFELTLSPDSSKVYTGECVANEVTYDIICVEMKEIIKDLTVAENVLEEYLNYIKSNFQITGAAGYGKGHRLRGKDNTRGMIDYWQDQEKNNIKVKGWTNGRFIAVLLVISPKELNEAKSNTYLDGIVFPDK